MSTLKPAQTDFRLATITDLPAIWVLMDKYKDRYVDDFEILEPGWVLGLIQSQQMWIICNPQNYPIACCWWTDWFQGLHCKIHGLIPPAIYRAVLKSKALETLLKRIAEQTGVQKLKASTMAHQRDAEHLLKRLGFTPVVTLSRETRYHGRATDVTWFEKLLDGKAYPPLSKSKEESAILTLGLVFFNQEHPQ